MSFLKEIKDQPRWVREVMFSLFVVVIASSVGMVWFNSFENDMYVLLNPEELERQRYIAEVQDKENQANNESIFATIGRFANNMSVAFGQISSVFDFSSDEQKVAIPGDLYQLPLSPNK